MFGCAIDEKKKNDNIKGDVLQMSEYVSNEIIKCLQIELNNISTKITVQEQLIKFLIKKFNIEDEEIVKFLELNDEDEEENEEKNESESL